MAKRSQQLSDKESAFQDLEARLLTTEASESACKRELDAVQVKLSREHESHDQAVKDLHSKLDRLRKETAEVKVWANPHVLCRYLLVHV